LERIEKVLDNYLHDYLRKDVIQGGCFFLTMLVDLSGTSNKILDRVLDGVMGFSNMLNQWLLEAQEKQMPKSGLDLKDIAKFITVSINGCTTIYASSRDPAIWKLTNSQLKFYINSLKR
jgi:TetR/AcrR family transcriptional repressor of nem operon